MHQETFFLARSDSISLSMYFFAAERDNGPFEVMGARGKKRSVMLLEVAVCSSHTKLKTMRGPLSRIVG